jgi:hypothetical protein
MTVLENYLRRYTTLPALIYLLTQRQITLLNPERWADRNDSYFLKLYREKKKLESVLALCFTQASETYHHWHVFANGPSGVCISFDRVALFDAIADVVRHGPVRYLKLGEMRNERLTTEELPFVKRYPFEDEREYRIICDSRNECQSLDLTIPLSCINRITLSPWLHRALFRQVKNLLLTIKGTSGPLIVRSTLIGNDEWMSFGDSAK